MVVSDFVALLEVHTQPMLDKIIHSLPLAIVDQEKRKEEYPDLPPLPAAVTFEVFATMMYKLSHEASVLF